METFFALLVICAGNPLVTGEFPSQSPVTRSFDVFFDLRLNISLSEQSRGWWFETSSRSLWRHCNVIWKALSPCHDVITAGWTVHPWIMPILFAEPMMMNDSESDRMTPPTQSEIFMVCNTTWLYNPYSRNINAQKNGHFLRNHIFQCISLMKIITVSFKFHWCVMLGVSSNNMSTLVLIIASVYLLPSIRQGSTQTNAFLIHFCIYVCQQASLN